MFDQLSTRLQGVFQKLRGKGRLTEDDVRETLREIRRALLEADVHHAVARAFVERIRERAVGEEILQSLSAGQQVVKIVHEELAGLLGGSQARLARSSGGATVVLMVGLQGAGKTTASAKLARWLVHAEHRRPLLVAADVYRPAAVDQLKILGNQVGVPVYAQDPGASPVDIVRGALEAARRAGNDYVIVDTAGRLHVDEALMEELRAIRDVSGPDEVLLVLDAMAGQDAVLVAEHFHRDLGVTGVVLTKLDGDARGGAALTVRQATGCAVKFVGTGEKADALEPFYPDRMASRILGMGDVLTLIERAQATFDERQARELESKIQRAEFTLEDFLSQLQQVRKLGPLDQLLGMIPGMSRMKSLQGVSLEDKSFKKIEVIIQSMTREERRRPELVEKSSSRRLRIARGSGTEVRDVNSLLRRFEELRKFMKQMTGAQKGFRGLPGLGAGGGLRAAGPKGAGPPRGHRGKKRR